MHTLHLFSSSYYSQGDDEKWTWIDGTPWDNTLWMPGQPSVHKDMDCIEYRAYGDRGWKVANCNSGYDIAFIVCQK